MENSVIRRLAERLGPPILTNSDEVRFCCFKSVCLNSNTKDTKYHMFVNPHNGRYFCHRCDKGGKLSYLLKSLGLPTENDPLSAWSQIINSFIYGTPRDTWEDTPRARAPIDMYKMLDGSEAMQYCLNRGITPARLEFYDVGIGTARMMEIPKEKKGLYAGAGRVVFPDYSKSGDIVYWVARSYTGRHPAKYKNAEVPRVDQIFNLGRLEKRGYKNRLIICEGPISAILAGYDAVCTYGKHVSGEQVQRLIDFKANEYIIAFDGDAIPTGVSLASRLFMRGAPVRFIKFDRPEDDPASVGTDRMRELVRTSLKWTPLTPALLLA